MYESQEDHPYSEAELRSLSGVLGVRVELLIFGQGRAPAFSCIVQLRNKCEEKNIFVLLIYKKWDPHQTGSIVTIVRQRKNKQIAAQATQTL